jgi:hypothetical protein
MERCKTAKSGPALESQGCCGSGDQNSEPCPVSSAGRVLRPGLGFSDGGSPTTAASAL